MRRLGVMLVVGALVLGAVSCADDEDGSSEPAGASTSTTAVAPAVAEGDRYVALGSSIASGFGISVQSTSCGRSDRNYPNLVAAQLGLVLTDVTCGAATVPFVVDTPQGTNPPQLDAVTPDTKLVTVTIGGNDIGYNATAVGCSDPQTTCSAPPELEANLAELGPALAAMIDQIQAAAPSATVVFVTYPREIPEGNCPELSYTDEEAELVRSMGERLEAVFVQVAQEADVVFVDPYVEPGDHTGCAPESERWTAGAVATDGFAYHPTALGHEVMAEMVLAALAG